MKCKYCSAEIKNDAKCSPSLIIWLIDLYDDKSLDFTIKGAFVRARVGKQLNYTLLMTAIRYIIIFETLR